MTNHFLGRRESIARLRVAGRAKSPWGERAAAAPLKHGPIYAAARLANINVDGGRAMSALACNPEIAMFERAVRKGRYRALSARVRETGWSRKSEE